VKDINKNLKVINCYGPYAERAEKYGEPMLEPIATLF
jgi:hypothetical protein